MSYADISLINCNRSSSIEAQGDNDSNPAIFTNTLQQTLKLNVGDQVSVERAFVNEVGAGNPSTIEFKGTTRRVKNGGNKSSSHTSKPYTNVVFGNYNYRKPTNGYDASYRLGNYLSIRTNLETTTETNLQDNLAPMIIGYYITANEYPNYIQQPRRFLQELENGNPVPTNSQLIWSNHDTTASGECKHTINPNCFAHHDWIKRPNPLLGGLYRQRVDNARFTMYIKNTVTYESTVAGSDDQVPAVRTDGVFSECTYYRLLEKIDLEIKKGFNTPTAVAEQITAQLTKTSTPDTFEILDTSAGTPYLRPLTQVIETPTHKSINCQNYFHCKSHNFQAYLDGKATVVGDPDRQKAVDWIASMGYIAVKRPEIWETGRAMGNALIPTEVLNRTTGAVETANLLYAWKGFQTLIKMDNSADPTVNFFPTQATPCVINVEYNEINLSLIRDFLDSQKLYPHLWDNLENTPAYSSAIDHVPDKDRSRFFHFNPFSATGMGTPSNADFGSDGFITEAGAQDVPKSTIPVFFKFREDQRDLFIPPEDWDDATDYGSKFSYGFAQPFKWSGAGTPTRYFIRIRPDLSAGIPHQLFTDAGHTLEFTRQCGFDFHATAFSTAVITPHSGYSYCDIGTKTRLDNGGVQTFTSFSDTSTQIKNVGDVNTTDISPYMSQTYIGANAPALQFSSETNRFSFSQFHTANNVGNEEMAGTTVASINNSSMYPDEFTAENKLLPPPINAGGGDTVYKINPRPTQFGYSPTFKPYLRYNQAYRTGAYPDSALAVHGAPANTSPNQQYYKVQNQNIEPYKIFDAHGGIYVEDWGANENEWSGSLWDILGFTYDQLNADATPDNVLIARVNNDNIKSLYRSTTNAEVVATDTKPMITNNFGANLYQTSLPFPSSILTWNVVPFGATKTFALASNKGTPLIYYPEIVIKTQSVSIEATNLAKSVLKPYYTLRSSILTGVGSIGGDPTGATLPLMGVIDKYSAQNDYFLGNPSDMPFTITKPLTISDITTSIHDPDGTFSNVDESSAVIYKVMKNRPLPQDIFTQIIEGDKKEEKKK